MEPGSSQNPKNFMIFLWPCVRRMKEFCFLYEAFFLHQTFAFHLTTTFSISPSYFPVWYTVPKPPLSSFFSFLKRCHSNFGRSAVFFTLAEKVNSAWKLKTDRHCLIASPRVKRISFRLFGEKTHAKRK